MKNVRKTGRAGNQPSYLASNEWQKQTRLRRTIMIDEAGMETAFFCTTLAPGVSARTAMLPRGVQQWWAWRLS